MRNLSSLIITFLYLGTSLGIPVSVHYCHNRIESVSVFLPDKICCCGIQSGDAQCCKNEHVRLQAGTDSPLVVAKQSLPRLDQGYALPWQNENKTTEISGGFSVLIPSDHPPPDPVPIRLFICSLIFFG